MCCWSAGLRWFCEMILLLGFQILEGFLYRQLALIITAFMGGMSLGTGIFAFLWLRINNPRRWFLLVQSALSPLSCRHPRFLFLDSPKPSREPADDVAPECRFFPCWRSQRASWAAVISLLACNLPLTFRAIQKQLGRDFTPWTSWAQPGGRWSLRSLPCPSMVCLRRYWHLPSSASPAS